MFALGQYRLLLEILRHLSPEAATQFTDYADLGSGWRDDLLALLMYDDQLKKSRRR